MRVRLVSAIKFESVESYSDFFTNENFVNNLTVIYSRWNSVLLKSEWGPNNESLQSHGSILTTPPDKQMIYEV